MSKALLKFSAFAARQSVWNGQ